MSDLVFVISMLLFGAVCVAFGLWIGATFIEVKKVVGADQTRESFSVPQKGA